MKNIFIVIDDDKLNNYLCKFLISANSNLNKIQSFTNPLEAFSCISETPIEPETIILLDINMPEIDGWEFLDKCQEIMINCRIYILTSSVSPADQDTAKKYPLVKGFFIKPMTTEYLDIILDTVS